MFNKQLITWLWVLAIGAGLYVLSPILMPFAVALLLAYLGDPLVDRLETLKLPRTLAVVIVFVVIIGLLVAAVMGVGPQLELQIKQLLAVLPEYAERMKLLIEEYLGLSLSLDSLQEGSFKDSLAAHWQAAGGVFGVIWQSISSSTLWFVALLTNLLLIPVLTFYLLRDWDRLVEQVHALLPRDSEKTISRLAKESDEVLGAFLRGQLVVMFALGVIYTTGLWMLDIKFALLIGMLAGVVSFVPYLGLIVGITVASLAAWLQFQQIDVLPAVMAVFIIGQLVEGLVLTPRLVGERIGLHPVAVIFAVMAGGQLYGFFGVLVALPVAAIAVVLMRHALSVYQQSKAYIGAKD
jgi:predicted PurR-regulated permease PerM